MDWNSESMGEGPMDWNSESIGGGGGGSMEWNCTCMGGSMDWNSEGNYSFANQAQTAIVCLDTKERGQQSTEGDNVNTGILHGRLILYLKSLLFLPPTYNHLDKSPVFFHLFATLIRFTSVLKTIVRENLGQSLAANWNT